MRGGRVNPDMLGRFPTLFQRQAPTSSIARALTSIPPKLLIFDEPTSRWMCRFRNNPDPARRTIRDRANLTYLFITISGPSLPVFGANEVRDARQAYSKQPRPYVVLQPPTPHYPRLDAPQPKPDISRTIDLDLASPRRRSPTLCQSSFRF